MTKSLTIIALIMLSATVHADTSLTTIKIHAKQIGIFDNIDGHVLFSPGNGNLLLDSEKIYDLNSDKYYSFDNALLQGWIGNNVLLYDVKANKYKVINLTHDDKIKIDLYGIFKDPIDVKMEISITDMVQTPHGRLQINNNEQLTTAKCKKIIKKHKIDNRDILMSDDGGKCLYKADPNNYIYDLTTNTSVKLPLDSRPCHRTPELMGYCEPEYHWFPDSVNIFIIDRAYDHRTAIIEIKYYLYNIITRKLYMVDMPSKFFRKKYGEESIEDLSHDYKIIFSSGDIVQIELPKN